MHYFQIPYSLLASQIRNQSIFGFTTGHQHLLLVGPHKLLKTSILNVNPAEQSSVVEQVPAEVRTEAPGTTLSIEELVKILRSHADVAV